LCTDTDVQCGIYRCNATGSCLYVSGGCTGTSICCQNFTPARCTTSQQCLL
jgi:hypothetical protein